MPQQEPELRERPSHHLAGSRPARFIRNPHVRVAPAKPRRHDSDQSPGRPIQNKCLVHDSRISPEGLHPRLIAQHEHWRRTRLILRRLHYSPEQRRHPQKLKRSRRYKIAVKALRPFTVPVQHIRSVVRNHSVKYMILLHIIQKLRPTEPRPSSTLASLGVMNLHGHVPLRIRIRKRLHQDVFYHAENCRGRSNSQRQRQDRHHRKPRRLPQIPQCVPDILPQRLHCPPSTISVGPALPWSCTHPAFTSASLCLSISTHSFVIKFDATAPKKLPDWPKTSLRAGRWSRRRIQLQI